jgi:hypothetical protein
MKNEKRNSVDPSSLCIEGSKHYKRNSNRCECCDCNEFFKSDREELRHLGFWQEVKDSEVENFWVCSCCGDLTKRQVRSRSKLNNTELNDLFKRLAPHLVDE